MMEDAMQACQNEGVSRDKQIPVDPVLIQDGPLVGAAVAARTTSHGHVFSVQYNIAEIFPPYL